MDYQFSEIRKGERADVLAFAKAQGCTVEPGLLRHHMSLGARAAGELVAAALCIEQTPAHFIIELVSPDGTDTALITELTDRCLRKVQAENIAAARLSSTAQAATEAIWSQTNWLNEIQETPPPTDDGSASQAA